MLGSLTAYERTPCPDAAFCNTTYYVGYFLRYIFAAGDIIKEKQRFRSAADYVVYAHRNAVDAYGVVPVQKHCQLYLGADSVGSRDKHRLLYALKIKSKATAKAAYVVKAACCLCSCNVRLHELDRFVACCDINACLGV